MEEDYGTILELLAGDALGLQTHPVAIEHERSFEIVHAEREEIDPRLHRSSLPVVGQASSNASGRAWRQLAATS